MNISIKDLMTLERILLEMTARVKFDMDFGDAYKLYCYLRDVGRITSYAFLIQNEFHKKYSDTEKLKEYHNKVMDSNVEFEYEKVTRFIDEMSDKYNNNGFSDIVSQFKFW